MLRFGSWEPDKADFGDNSCLEALNVIPADGGYRPIMAYGAISAALGERVQGAIFIRKTDGTAVIVAGTATKLYMLISGTTFTDVTRTVGGAYATPADAQWRFSVFGSIVYAQNGFDTAQQFNLDTDSNFSAASGSKPTVKYEATVGDFTMTGNQGAFRNRVQWGPFGNVGAWTASQVTQASYQDLPDGGWIQGVVGIEYVGIILQEFAIRRAAYEGVPNIFRFSKVGEGIGCTIPGTVAQYREFIFFCDRTGFYNIVGGSQLVPIGSSKWNRWFWDNVDLSNLHRVTAAIDPVNSCYIVSFPDLTAISGTPNHWLIYSWQEDRGSHAQPGDHEMIFSAATQSGYTLEGLDAISTDIDTGIPFSLDSQVWSGVARKLVGGFGTDHKLGFYNGANLAATVDTMEGELIPGQKARVRQLRSISDGGSPTIALGTRNRTNDAVSFGSDIAQDALGVHKFRSKARYHRARMKQAAGLTWTHMQGVDDIKATPAGTR